MRLLENFKTRNAKAQMDASIFDRFYAIFYGLPESDIRQGFGRGQVCFVKLAA